MIKMDHVRAGSHQYSCRCGWIDNDHASMGDSDDDIRLDVVENWKQFPGGPGAHRSPGLQGFVLSYRQPVGIMSHLAKVTFPMQWFIRDQHAAREAYRGVALRLYQVANDHLETLQGGPSEPFRHSSFSYEDLSSNLIAWYRGVLGFSRGRVQEICEVVSQAEALALATAINIDGILDKNRVWGKTLLFSDRCEECKRRGSAGSGLSDMPAEFMTVKPGVVTFSPGSGDAWPPQLDPLLQNHPYDKNHLPWWDRPPSGGSGTGRGGAKLTLGDLLGGVLGNALRRGPLGRD